VFSRFDSVCWVFLAISVHVLHLHRNNIVLGASLRSYFDSILVYASSYHY